MKKLLLQKQQNQKNKENKVWSILAYFGILFFLPLVGVPNSAYGKFHANQGLILLIFYVTLTVASWLVQAVLGMIPIIGVILSGLVQLAVSVCIIALIVFGMVQAAQGKAKTLPVIGKFHLIG